MKIENKFIKKKHDKKSKNNNKSDALKLINKKYLKNGSYSFSMIAIFVIIIIVINSIVGEIPTKYTQIDVSSEKIYSIGEQTEELLESLEEKVTIYHVVQSGYEDEVISNLLKKYDESDKVEVIVKDPVVNPKFVSEYTSDSVTQNSLIVEYGEKYKLVDYNDMYETSIDYYSYSTTVTGFDGEGQITSAIAYVTAENLPKLYVLEGHGELELNSTLQLDVEKGNIEIVSLNLLTEEAVPEDAECIMINAPASDIAEDEAEKVIEYLENGGKAIIFSDYVETEMPNFDSILENYGVKRAEGIVMEGNSQYYAMQMPYYLLPDVENNSITSDVKSEGYYVLVPYAQGIRKIDGVRDTISITSLLTTSDEAYSKINLAGDTLERASEDIDGPFDLGVLITEEIAKGTTEIVYFSTSALQDSQVNQIVSGGNEKLIMGAVNELLSSEESISVSIPSKSVEVSYLSISAYDSNFWMICTIGLIPGFFLVAGFVIWFKRRRA